MRPATRLPMTHTTQRTPLSPTLHISRWLAGPVAALALLACGGGGGTSTSPPAGTTSISGAVVKGPVNGAQVCGFALAGNTQGAPVGTCVTTDASGNYTLILPVGTGSLWLQATGGSYADEVTSAITNLSAGGPLSTLVTANGGTVNAMLTPLTTLALNAAAANVGSGGTLNAAAFNAAVSQVLTAFGLTGLDIHGTLPLFGAGINNYGTALTAISQMVANGTSLATILANSNPSLLTTAYTAAAQTAGGTGNSGAGSGGSGASGATASGTLALSGANPAVAAWGNFTPQASGFELKLSSGSEAHSSNLNDPSSTSYVFYKTATDANGQSVRVEIAVSKTNMAFAPVWVSYTYGSNQTVRGSGGYVGAGTVTISTPAGASHPVSVQFDQFKPSFDLTLHGTLVGDTTGALWTTAELPGTTSGNAAIDGTAFSPTDAVVNSQGTSALYVLSDGRTLQLVGNTAHYTNQFVYSCFSNCGISAVANAGGGTTFTFANTRLDRPNNGGSRTLGGSITIGKTTGSLSTTNLGTFTPTGSTLGTRNDALISVFSGGAEGSPVIRILTVTQRNATVVGVLANLSSQGNGQTYGCGAPADAAPGVVLPTCSGVTVDSSGLGVSFSNTSLGGSVAVGGVLPTQVLNGTVTAKGR